MPTCGAVIQPIAVSVTSTASPLAAAASAAMPPVMTSGRPGWTPWPSAARGLRPSPGEPDPAGPAGPLTPPGPSPEPGTSGASADTLTPPILATIAAGRPEARRAGQRVRMMSRMRLAVSLGVLPTRTPAFSRASFLAWAVPEEPEMIAPAWPMVLPSGAVNPAT